MRKGVDHIGVAAVPMLHDGNDKYLMSLRTENCRDEQHRWEPAGGGGVEHGEDIETALRREVKEECNVDIYELEFLGFREVFREVDGAHSHFLAFDFRGRIDPKQVNINEPDMCAELRWCSIDEIPEPRHSQFPVFLEKYKDKL